jgi:hypothetical protein
MIRIGYEKTNGDQVVAGEFMTAPEANECMAQLILDTNDKDDIALYYYATVMGDNESRYGYIYPS